MAKFYFLMTLMILQGLFLSYAKAFSNVSQTESLSSFSESASVNASVTVSGPSYSSKSELASHNATASLSQDVSVISSALQSQSSAPPSSSNVSTISTSASEDGSSSASYLKSISPSVSQNISASKTTIIAVQFTVATTRPAPTTPHIIMSTLTRSMSPSLKDSASYGSSVASHSDNISVGVPPTPTPALPLTTRASSITEVSSQSGFFFSSFSSFLARNASSLMKSASFTLIVSRQSDNISVVAPLTSSPGLSLATTFSIMTDATPMCIWPCNPTSTRLQSTSLLHHSTSGAISTSHTSDQRSSFSYILRTTSTSTTSASSSLSSSVCYCPCSTTSLSTPTLDIAATGTTTPAPTGLKKNQTAPTPRVPSKKEIEEAVQFVIRKSGFEWDFEKDMSFKDKMASATTEFCTENRTRCALKDARRKRRSPTKKLYTADQVHLLPGYPSNATGSLQVAFYVQQPPGHFIGDISVLPRSTLEEIILTHESALETAIGANISDVQFLFTPTTSPTAGPVEPSSNVLKWVAIGVGVGVLIIILIISIVFRWMKNKAPNVKHNHRPEPGEAWGSYNMYELN